MSLQSWVNGLKPIGFELLENRLHTIVTNNKSLTKVQISHSGPYMQQVITRFLCLHIVTYLNLNCNVALIMLKSSATFFAIGSLYF